MERPRWPVIAGTLGMVVSAALAALGDVLPGVSSPWLIGGTVVAAGVGVHLALRGVSEGWGAPGAGEQRAAVFRIKATMLRALEASGAEARPMDPPVSILPGQGPLAGLDLDAVPDGPELSTRAFIDDLMESWSTTSAGHCTLLLGAPGAGKTRLAYELTRMLADAYLDDSSRQIPIYLRTSGWDPERTSVRGWVTERCADDFQISTRLTDRWLRNSTIFLIIDGIDELPDHARPHCVDAINEWTRSATGSPVLIVSRISEYASCARWLRADRVAVLNALSITSVQSHLRAALSADRLSSEHADLDALVEAITVGGPELSRPAFLQLVIDSLSAVQPHDEGGPADGARADFLAGVSHRHLGDVERAREAFTRVLGHSRSPWRSLAAIRLSLLLREQGDARSAEELLRKSLGWRLQQSIHDAAERRRTAPLTEAERQVLRCMGDGVSYDLGQVSAQARLSLGESSDSLRSLREKGLIETYQDPEGHARFRRLLGEAAGSER